MTVCFEFDPKEEPWITPFDRFDTRGNPVADNKISTYDIQAIPHALFNYSVTAVGYEDEKRCDAFYNEIVKLRFFREIIEPQAKHGSAFWRSDIWKRDIEKNRAAAINQIAQRQHSCNKSGDCWPKIKDEVKECDWMGECWDNSFASAKHFINCAAQSALGQVNNGTPLLAGIGIVLERKTGQLPRIGYAIPEAHHKLRDFGFYLSIDSDIVIASIDGKTTESMTTEEMQSALNGPVRSYVELGIAGFDWSEERMCSTQPKLIGTIRLKRTLTAGDLMTQCGGLDL